MANLRLPLQPRHAEEGGARWALRVEVDRVTHTIIIVVIVLGAALVLRGIGTMGDE